MASVTEVCERAVKRASLKLQLGVLCNLHRYTYIYICTYCIMMLISHLIFLSNILYTSRVTRLGARALISGKLPRVGTFVIEPIDVLIHSGTLLI